VSAKAMKKLLHAENGDNNIYPKNEHYSYLLNGVCIQKYDHRNTEG
jgi:hypothetical protein